MLSGFFVGRTDDGEPVPQYPALGLNQADITSGFSTST